MRREEKTMTDRQAIQAILKKARVSRLAGCTQDTAVPATHES
jgi:nitroimidazol reductase NimA-like FMN-containing flavoprotein (pyridoxamine 5'-phosphate oxidase superfamily)